MPLILKLSSVLENHASLYPFWTYPMLPLSCKIGPDWCRKWLIDFSTWKTQLVSFLIALVVLMWKWMSLFLRKNHLLRCWGWLCSIYSLDCSIAKTISKKIGGFIFSIKFLLRLLCISINLSYNHVCSLLPCLFYIKSSTKSI